MTPRALATRDLDVGVGGGDVRVEAAAAGGDGVGGHRRVGRRAPRIGTIWPMRVVLAVLGALDPDTLVGGQERRCAWSGTAR